MEETLAITVPEMMVTQTIVSPVTITQTVMDFQTVTATVMNVVTQVQMTTDLKTVTIPGTCTLTVRFHLVYSTSRLANQSSLLF